MDRLKKKLRNSLKGAERVAVLGIGSQLRGDDAAGPLFIRELAAALKGTKKSAPVKLFSCGTAPENYTGDIRKFNPTRIVIVDAVDMGKPAGRAEIVAPAGGNERISFSTHRLPLSMFIEYLKRQLDCEIITIGIQPKSIDFGSPLCDNVRAAVKEIKDIVLASLNPDFAIGFEKNGLNL